MAITRWQPYRELTQFQDRMNRLFDELWGNGGEMERAQAAWAPAVDICEEEDRIVLKADLPGVEQKDIHLDVEGGRLTIKGERRLERSSDDEGCHRLERAYGAFVRSFRLPDVIDPDGIKAAYKDGVLEVTLPKKEEVKPRKVEIASA